MTRDEAALRVVAARRAHLKSAKAHSEASAEVQRLTSEREAIYAELIETNTRLSNALRDLDEVTTEDVQ